MRRAPGPLAGWPASPSRPACVYTTADPPCPQNADLITVIPSCGPPQRAVSLYCVPATRPRRAWSAHLHAEPALHAPGSAGAHPGPPGLFLSSCTCAVPPCRASAKHSVGAEVAACGTAWRCGRCPHKYSARANGCFVAQKTCCTGLCSHPGTLPLAPSAPERASPPATSDAKLAAVVCCGCPPCALARHSRAEGESGECQRGRYPQPARSQSGMVFGGALRTHPFAAQAGALPRWVVLQPEQGGTG